MTLDRGFKCLTSKLIGDQFALTTFSLTFCHLTVTRVECLNDVTIQSYSIRRSLSLSSLSFFTLLRPLPSSFFDSMISQIMLTYFVILCEAIIAVPTAGLLFYLFTFSCFAYVERKTDLFPWSSRSRQRESRKEKLLLNDCLGTSVTRWLDYFSIFGHLKQ